MVFPMDNLQDEFFYGLMWCKSITESLITFLLAQKQMGNWVWNLNNAPALLEACDYLNSTFHTNYTSIEVLGRVKKLRSRYRLFSHMISQSSVVWNREQNYVYASQAQWALSREMYPMARAYITQGDPLYTELKSLFAPDDAPPDGPFDEDELIVIVDDDDDEDFPLLPLLVVHALPALDQFDFNHILVPDSPVNEVMVISSDDYSDDMYGYFDSDVELDFSDDENHIPVLMIEEVIGEVVDLIPSCHAASNADLESIPDVPVLPNADVSIPSASLTAIRAVIRSIPPFDYAIILPHQTRSPIKSHCHATLIL